MKNATPAGAREMEALVAAHSRLVRSFFLRRCLYPEDAEDLAQEAFLAIMEGLPRFRGNSAISTWIWTICRHVYARHLRTKTAREGVLARFIAEESLAPEGASAEEGDDDDRIAIAIVLGRLGPGDRLLYRCAYQEGLGVREIAAALGKPEGTIKYQLHILRERLRDALARGEGGARDLSCEAFRQVREGS